MNKLVIDRSHFYSIGDSAISHTVEGFTRDVSQRDAESYFVNKAAKNGLTSISNVALSFDGNMIQVDAFETGTIFKADDFFVKDIREGNVLRIKKKRARMSMIFK